VNTTRKTKEQERERVARVIAHARAGHTMTEIVDMEGLDAGNVKKWHEHVRNAGVSIEKGRASRPSIGITEQSASWRYNLGRSLGRLRDHLPQIEVSRMVGMTNMEIVAATGGTKRCPSPHNWTTSQLQRLADAQGVTFEQLVTRSFHEVVMEKYR
jgi:hypothetical protein